MKTSHIFRLFATLALLFVLLPLPVKGQVPRKGTPAPATPGATITVNDAGDQPDANPGDGICDIQDPPTVPHICTLRAALNTAEAAGGGYITFAEPYVIELTDTLTVSGNTTIDGLSSGSRVVLDGSHSISFTGLEVWGDNVTVMGMVISNFHDYGIHVVQGSSNITIKSNYIGTDATGMVAQPNAIGIFVYEANGVTIGGTNPGDRNVISGNNRQTTGYTPSGLYIENSDNVLVINNWIGIDANGTGALGNDYGIMIENSEPTTGTITIGGNFSGIRNVISGNTYYGIAIRNGTQQTLHKTHTVQGNFIGTDVNGTKSIGTGQGGIWIDASQDVVIGAPGGTAIPDRCDGYCNLISGNGGDGIYMLDYWGWGPSPSENMIQGNFIGTDVNGTKAIPNNEHGIEIDGDDNSILGNLVSGNKHQGIKLRHSGNVVRGNFIGTDINGTASLGNGNSGVKVEGDGNVIGSDAGAPFPTYCQDDCNLISGNGEYGIMITGNDNTVQGNFVGTDVNGAAAVPNGGGVLIFTGGAGNHLLGNLVSGNSGHGVAILSDGNVVRGNFVGTDVTGQETPLGNGAIGVVVGGGEGNIIGGDAGNPLPSTCEGDCNLISANGGSGIAVTGEASNTIVNGNFIGTDVNGAAKMGNQDHGVWSRILNTTISNNLISGNNRDGVRLDRYADDVDSGDSTVQANLIGTARDGKSWLGNGGYGAAVYSSSGNLIGGDQDGQGNTIAFNAQGGVVISDTTTATVNNSILRNAIFENLGTHELGIDLGGDGVTENDADDGDSGPNNLQNFPVITDTQGSQVSGVLTSTANTTFRLEFFSNPKCSTSNHGQGKTYLGSADVTTGGNGRADFQVTLTTAPLGGEVVVATATDPDGNTSEFSACYGGLVVNSVGDDGDNNWGDGVCTTGQTIANGDPECTLRAAIQEANGDSSPNTIRFDIPNVSDVPVIWPDSPLPQINYPVVINGTTQAGGWVELDAGQGGPDGLDFEGGDSRLSGLVICYFSGQGIVLGNGNNNVIAGNLIGIQTDNTPCSIGGNGIRVAATSDNNIIGGVTAAERNVIANSEFSGIYVMAGSSGNTIRGNYIGTNRDGSAAQGNTSAGVHIEGHGNTVGGTTGVSAGECSGACNLISGNRYGVFLSGSGAITNTVQGNFIGTNHTGTAALGNTEVGVVVTDGASDNQVGGGNLISGNGPSGVSQSAAQTTLYGGVVVNGSASTGNQVENNTIGTQAGGDQALPNQGNGVWVYEAPDTTVADNLISGNQGHGVEVVGNAATGNLIQGNLVGTNSDGTTALPNSGTGVWLNGAPNNTVGGTTSGQENLLSGNGGNGLKISGNGADNNVVQGNVIGVNTVLTASLPNGGDGILIGEGASGNQIGGTAEGAENVISSNHSDGVEINGVGTTGNAVQGNYIGTLSDGVTRLGNWGQGVYIASGASNNTIGGVITPTANLIAFNGGDGVYVASGSANAIRHNLIYTNTGLGIDLGTNGVTPNDEGDGDSGANNLQNYPLLTSAVITNGVATVKGTLNSTAAMTYTLEFFANTSCDPSLYGEGERFVGTITVTTDAGGNATFVFTPTAIISDSEKLAATATDANGNTSEFSKCARPTERVPVDPAVGATLVLTDTQGNLTTIEIPAGAITYTETITFSYALIEDGVSASGFAFASHAFELSAYLGDTLLQGLAFSPPITVTIHYSDGDVAGMDEEDLTLLYWDGAAWSDEGISVVERNPADNYVRFTVAHLSDFALFTETFQLYLPVVMRNYAP